MFRYLYVAFLFAFSVAGFAQENIVGSGVYVTANTYTGPGDVVSGALAWWGLRAYNRAYATSTGNVGIFRRSSDSTTCTGKVNTKGQLDLTTTYCAGSTNLVNWCGASSGTCSATTLYDQSGANACSSGACNITQATNGTQPQLSFNCLNTSLPCLILGASGGQSYSLATAVMTFTTAAQPYTASLVAYGLASPGANDLFVGADNVANAQSGWVGPLSGGADWYMYAAAGSSINVAVSNSAWHAVQAYFDGASSEFNIDGTDNGGTTGTDGLTAVTQIWVGAEPTGLGSETTSGKFAEGGYWPNGSSTNRLATCNNQQAYWGTPAC